MLGVLGHAAVLVVVLSGAGALIYSRRTGRWSTVPKRSFSLVLAIVLLGALGAALSLVGAALE